MLRFCAHISLNVTLDNTISPLLYIVNLYTNASTSLPTDPKGDRALMISAFGLVFFFFWFFFIEKHRLGVGLSFIAHFQQFDSGDLRPPC